jgi:hypothetical protein
MDPRRFRSPSPHPSTALVEERCPSAAITPRLSCSPPRIRGLDYPQKFAQTLGVRTQDHIRSVDIKTGSYIG